MLHVESLDSHFASVEVRLGIYFCNKVYISAPFKAFGSQVVLADFCLPYDHSQHHTISDHFRDSPTSIVSMHEHVISINPSYFIVHGHVRTGFAAPYNGESSTLALPFAGYFSPPRAALIFSLFH